MKIKTIIIIFCFYIFFTRTSFATEEIYNEVSNGFGISNFTKEASQYTKDNFPDFDLDTFIKNSIKGKSDLSFFKKIVIETFGDEIVSRYKAND